MVLGRAGGVHEPEHCVVNNQTEKSFLVLPFQSSWLFLFSRDPFLGLDLSRKSSTRLAHSLRILKSLGLQIVEMGSHHPQLSCFLFSKGSSCPLNLCHHDHKPAWVTSASRPGLLAGWCQGPRTKNKALILPGPSQLYLHKRETRASVTNTGTNISHESITKHEESTDFFFFLFSTTSVWCNQSENACKHHFKSGNKNKLFEWLTWILTKLKTVPLGYLYLRRAATQGYPLWVEVELER